MPDLYCPTTGCAYHRVPISLNAAPGTVRCLSCAKPLTTDEPVAVDAGPVGVRESQDLAGGAAVVAGPRTAWVSSRPGEGNVVVQTQLALPIGVLEAGEIRVYRIVLPFLPPSKNVYDGWLPAWQSAAKQKWVNAICREVTAQQIPSAPRIGLSAKLVFPTNNRRDPQNYANCLWNWVPDALRKAGVISGDHAGKIDFGPNLGVTFAWDPRAAPKSVRSVTHLAISMVVPA